MTTLSIGQLGSLKAYQGSITRQEWKSVLKYGRNQTSEFRRRVDSLQDRIEERSDAPGFEMSAPISTVQDRNLIVYKTVQVEMKGETKTQLTARKLMYDSGYSVIADFAIGPGSSAPVDSLQEYIRVTSFSVD